MHTCSSGRLAWCVALVLPRARSSRRQSRRFPPEVELRFEFDAVWVWGDRTFTLQVRDLRQPRLT